MINFLNEHQIKSNFERFLDLVETTSHPERSKLVINMIEDLGERVYISPASSMNKAHNAFPGGYLDHVLRVHDNAKTLYQIWTRMGMDMSGFDLEELLFAALFHDFGKLGKRGKGNEYYLVNDNAWEIENRGKDYKINDKLRWMSVPDLGLCTLQDYGITLTENEWVAIKIHDGLYDDHNKHYFKNYAESAKFKDNLIPILMDADYMAMLFEYQRYASGKLKNTTIGV